MSMITAQATDLAELLFNNTTWAGIGDATGIVGSGGAGSFYVGLWVGDPTATGAGGAEASYTGYARVAVARTSGGFTVATTNVSNAAAVTFGECTAGSDTVTHFALMSAATAGVMVIRGALDSSLAISTSANQIPQFAIGALDIDVTTAIS